MKSARLLWCPSPAHAAPGRTRRSVASSYYTNRHPNDFSAGRHPSTFLPPDRTSLAARLKSGVRYVTPPLVWHTLKSLVKGGGKTEKY